MYQGMEKIIEAARQALEALETISVDVKTTSNAYEAQRQAAEALRHALENHESAYQRGYLDGMAKPCIDCADRKLQAFKQPKQEPVAWMYDWKTEGVTVTDWVTSDKDEAYSPTKGYVNIRPLYTEPLAVKVNTEMIEALRAFLRAPSVGSSGYGSSTIVVQDFHLRAARAAIAKVEGTV